MVWPARIQPLKGRLRDRLPESSELWLDGAHNAHGAAALARSLEEMNVARPKPLVLILGMMNTREPRDFLEPFKPMQPKVLTLTIPLHACRPGLRPGPYTLVGRVSRPGPTSLVGRVSRPGPTSLVGRV